MNTDRVEKQVLLRAPLARVWDAVSDATRFGTWFGMRLDGAFEPGAHLVGRIAPTTVDAEVASLQKPHEGKRVEFWVERIEPMRRITLRWHPFAVDPTIDYSAEHTTEIVFELESVADGTRLTITESGFDRLPLARRAAAFKANDAGWAHQTRLLQKYLALGAAGDAASA